MTWQERQSIRGFTVGASQLCRARTEKRHTHNGGGLEIKPDIRARVTVFNAPQRHTGNACALGRIGCRHAPLDPPGAHKPPQ